MRRATKWKVYLDGLDRPDLRPIQVAHNVNAYDSASLVRVWAEEGKFPGVNDRLVDIKLSEAGSYEIEITKQPPDKPEQTVFVGRVAAQSLRIGDDEQISYSCRVMPWQLGVPVSRVLYATPTNGNGETPINFTDEAIWLDLPLVFNPTIDGEHYGNKHPSLRFAYGPAGSETSVFLHPFSGLTASAREYYGDVPVSAVSGSGYSDTFQERVIADGNLQAAQWTLPEIVEYLCVTLNPYERDFRNPLISDVERALRLSILDGDQDMNFYEREVRVPAGMYLLDALSVVLKPRGFAWSIDYSGERGEKPRIKIFSATAGEVDNEIWLRLARPGESVNDETCHLETMDIDQNFASIANRVRVVGAPIRFEGTFELVRAWAKEHDETTLDELILPDSIDDETLPRDRAVWRKWVLNEAGDYNALERPDAPYSTFDFLDTFDRDTVVTGDVDEELSPPGKLTDPGYVRWLPRRRRFLPTMTCREDGTPIGNVGGACVEIKDGIEYTDWTSVSEAGFQCRLLQKECGVEFALNERIIDAGDGFQVRITATVESDTRVEAIARQQLANEDTKDHGDGDDAQERSSAINWDSTLVIDAGERLQVNEIQLSSKFADSAGNTTGLYTLRRNDLGTAQAIADQAMRDSDVARITGQATIFGQDHDQYVTGAAVLGVDGRNIDFNCRRDGTGPARYPVISTVVHLCEQQTLRLSFDGFRDRI